MTKCSKPFIFDACLFAEGEFSGCAPDVIDSGLSGFLLTVPRSGEGFREAARSIAVIHGVADDPGSRVMVARNHHDLLYAQETDQVGVVLWFQDPHAMENSLDLLRVFYELGVRAMQLTYNQSNYLGTGCTEPVDAGLSGFGRRVVREMNRLGMVVDLSHSSRQTALDTLEVSDDPVLFSHANAKVLTDSPRNKEDDELKLVAAGGGVIGLTPWGPLCWKGQARPSLDDYLDHIDYMVDLVGVDHVGFGSDNTPDHSTDQSGTVEQAALYPAVVAEYNRVVGTSPDVRHAEGFSGPHQVANLVEGLKRRGYSQVDINKILGANFLRVFGEVWR